MTVPLARALMKLAARSLGESRRAWAAAMQAEFAVALDDGRPLAFAAGCLVAAWREMPRHEHGRSVLANHALALGLLIPMAVLQLQCVIGPPDLSLGYVAPGSARDLVLGDAYRAATPSLLALWLLLGVGHLRLAWLLLERNWTRLVSLGALMLGTSATLIIFTVVLFIDDPAVGLQALLLAIELTAISVLARWHSRLFASALPRDLAC